MLILFLISILFLIFPSPSLTTSFTFPLDNTNNPSVSLYSAFSNAKTAHPSATSQDEFHFQLVPSSIPYPIKTSEAAQGLIFDQVSAKIFIESSDTSKLAIIDWQAWNFTLQVKTSLSITNIQLDGSSVHVANHSLCIASPCCLPSSLLNTSNICGLYGMSFQKGTNFISEGLINLIGTNASLNLQYVTISNFYAILNFNALIYDQNMNSQITVRDLNLLNVFFSKGVFYIDYLPTLATKSFSFSFNDIIISQWNGLGVSLDFAQSVVLNERQNQTFLVAMSNFSSLAVSNITVDGMSIGAVFILRNMLNFSCDKLYLTSFNGTTIIATNSSLSLSNYSLSQASVASVSDSFLVLEAYYMLGFTLTKADFKNTYGSGIIIGGPSSLIVNISDVTMSNALGAPPYYSLILFSLGDPHYTYVKNVVINDILQKDANVFVEYFYSQSFVISNIVCYNILLKNIFNWQELTVSNGVFFNINTEYAIFGQAANPVPRNLYSNLLVQNCTFTNLSSQMLGPISFALDAYTVFTFENCLFQNIVNAYVTFFPFPKVNIYYHMHNLTFHSFDITLGYILFLYKDQSLDMTSCTFDNLTYSFPSIYRGIFRLFNSPANVTNCSFANLRLLNTSADIIEVQDSFINITDCRFLNLTIEGKGGINIHGSLASLLLVNSSFDSISNQEEGFWHLYGMGAVTLSNSSFNNFAAFKFSAFYVEDITSMTVSLCNFTNIYASIGSTVFWITAKYSASGFIDFLNNRFTNCTAKGSSGAGLSFKSCFLPLRVINVSFSGMTADSAACLCVENLISILLKNVSYSNTRTQRDGGVVFLTNVAGVISISDNHFSDNWVNSGKGNNLYLQNSNCTIENTTFMNSYSSQGNEKIQASAIYGFYSMNQSFFLTVSNCRFKKLQQERDVITIISSLIINLLFQELSFEGIYSKNGNGILSCQQCAGTFENLSIFDSVVMGQGNMFTMLNSGNDNESLLVTGLKVRGNSILSGGSFAQMMNISNILFDDLRFDNNTLLSSFLQIEYFSLVEMRDVVATLNSLEKLGKHQPLGDFDNGDALNISNLFLISDTSSCLSLNNITNVSLVNLSADSHFQDDDTDFVTISLCDSLIMSNYSVINSKTNSFSVLKTSKILLSLITLSQIAFGVQNNQNLMKFTSIDFLSIDAVHMSSIPQAFFFSNVNRLTLSNIIIENSSSTALSLFALRQATLSNVTVHTIQNGGALTLSNPLPIQNASFTLTNSSISNAGTDLSGALNLTGSFSSISFSGVSFTANKGNPSGVPGSSFSYFSSTASCQFSISNCSFSSAETAYLIVPNQTFYKVFLASLPKSLTIRSYVARIEATINHQGSSQIYRQGDVIAIRSGEQVELIFNAYDHFGFPANSTDSMRVEILKNTSEQTIQYTIMNPKAVFIRSQAYISAFSTIFDSSTPKNASISLSVEFSNYGDIIPPDMTFNFQLLIKLQTCDTGYTIINNICTQCDSKHYSLTPTPTNTTQCFDCPPNAQCLNGKTITPEPGFWNLDSSDPEIFQCESIESCDSGCQRGYFGYVCHECQEGFGKTLIRRCVSCQSGDYLSHHIVRSVAKWALFGIIALIQSELVEDFGRENERTLYSIVNVFSYHTTMVGLTSRFHSNFASEYENFLETQSSVSFFENNLFLVYCFFPEMRDFKLYYLIFVYFLLIPLFQMVFLFFALGVKVAFKVLVRRRNYESEDLRNVVVNGICLIFFNNFITLFYYFIGLVFFINISAKLSIFFMEMGMHDREFYLLLFLIFPGILAFFAYPALFFIRKQRKHGIVFLFDCDYQPGYKKTIIFHYLTMFFALVFSHYSFLGVNYAKFSKNLYMIYLILMTSLKFCRSEGLQYLKIFSMVTITVSFYENFNAIITLNCVFYGLLLSFAIYVKFFAKSKKFGKSVQDSQFTMKSLNNY